MEVHRKDTTARGDLANLGARQAAPPLSGRLNVSVRDNGVGMTAEEQGRAFDEFFRANHAGTAQVPGAGLGLSIVKQLVDLHQGRVAVQSEPGKGSTFTVSLPGLPPRASGEPGPAGPLL